MINIGDPWTATPEPTQKWLTLSENNRLTVIEYVLGTLFDTLMIRPLAASDNGRITATLLGPYGPAVRGQILRQAERQLKMVVDNAITIWLPPMDDKNKVRAFRGIEVKEYATARI